MKKVLLLAYTNVNFGDDMFVKTICEYFKGTMFYIEAPSKYKEIFSDSNNLIIINDNLIKKIFNRIDRLLVRLFPSKDMFFRRIWIKNYDAVVYVIGALFDDDDLHRDLIEKIGIHGYKKMMWKNSFYKDVPFFLLGCNMTRVQSNNYVESMKTVFSGLQDICFRDKYSYDFFSALENVRYAPDMVFNYNCNSKPKDKVAVISVWGPLNKLDEFPQWKWAESWWSGYQKFLVSAMNELSNLEYKIILLSLCEAEGDLKACELIRKDSKVEADIINYHGNINEIIQIFEEAEFVVGTRFHSIVMAINAKCKFFPIIYESKSEQLLNDLKYNGVRARVDSVNEDGIKDLIYACQNGYELELANVKKRASEQFLMLSKILEGGE